MPKFKQVARLAIENFADRLQCAQAKSPGLARFEDREVLLRDPDRFRKIFRAHLFLGEHHIKVNKNRHFYTVACCSSFIAAASSKIQERSKSVNPTASIVSSCMSIVIEMTRSPTGLR